MATINAINTGINFEIVKKDGSSMISSAEREIETESIAGSDLKIYHLYVKFEGKSEVTEWTVAAKTKDVAFRMLQAIGHEAKKQTSDEFKDFYKMAKVEPVRTLIVEDPLSHKETLQLFGDHPLRGSFLNHYYAPLKDKVEHSKQQAAMINEYAAMFREIAFRHKPEYVDIYVGPKKPDEHVDLYLDRR